MSMMRSKKKEKFPGIGYDFLQLHDLPDEIVINILERLNSSAKLRFSAVCRAWKFLLRRLLPFLASEANQLPWFLNYDRENRSLVLVEPCSASHHKSCTELKRDLEQEPFYASIPTCTLLPLGVQFGWIAFLSRFYNTKPQSIFLLYSPFTRKFIRLPDLINVDVDGLAMSHPPTCSDCVFFICTYNFQEDRATAYTCRHGHKNWKKHDTLWNGPIRGLMFYAGRFYCLFGSATFAAFDVANESWQVLGQPPIPSDVYSAYQLVESVGNVLLVRHSNLQCYTNVPSHEPAEYHCGVWKYEGVEKGWTEMKSLDGRLLCLDISLGGTAIAAAGELEGLADRIYFATRYPFYFSLQDGRLHRGPDFDGDLGFRFWIMPPLQV